ncbi:POU domain, class 4, transcription factor 2 [Varanus komodoensis]|uniref:POU domain, class 4, transcription factor 2 n=1 Tax=Varanus komodoensis TaxID=61221 RepID=UPI001CF793C6|nr:POU domain, class 4, transcription factor 2 [Varanus komodoensis]KAF7244084.1 POU domain, class 4, transcription factor 2 [Varanus komodoensis]
MMMMSLNSKQPFGMAHAGGGGGGGGSLHEPKYSALHSASPCTSSAAAAAPSASSPSITSASGGRSSAPSSTTSSNSTSEAMRRACLPTPPSNIFGGLDESLLARAEALAAVDIVSPGKSHHHHPPHHSPFKPDATYHTMNTIPCTSAASSSSVPISHPSALSGTHHHHHHHHHHHQPHQALEGELLEHITPGLALGAMTGPDGSVVSTPGHAPHMASMNPMHQAALSMAHAHGLPSHMGCMSDVDADPRDLEAFAERFKQRRIKLGVTQADVGSALANLKIPGVGSLSQSTICRFESLTLSHNNMIALKPILQAWLEEAEKSHREKLTKPELFNGAEKKRKRTSIAAPEKRSLEAYFAIQPRPSSEKIAAIAEKLDLKKNVVRVWFCNQRQKQKRMKYSAGI